MSESFENLLIENLETSIDETLSHYIEIQNRESRQVKTTLINIMVPLLFKTTISALNFKDSLVAFTRQLLHISPFKKEQNDYYLRAFVRGMNTTFITNLALKYGIPDSIIDILNSDIPDNQKMKSLEKIFKKKDIETLIEMINVMKEIENVFKSELRQIKDYAENRPTSFGKRLRKSRSLRKKSLKRRK
jgi:protein associated with RNAse G/E